LQDFARAISRVGKIALIGFGSRDEGEKRTKNLTTELYSYLGSTDELN
jgi:hypothetical protein